MLLYVIINKNFSLCQDRVCQDRVCQDRVCQDRVCQDRVCQQGQTDQQSEKKVLK